MSAEQPSRWDRVRELRARQSALYPTIAPSSQRASAEVTSRHVPTCRCIWCASETDSVLFRGAPGVEAVSR